MIEPAIVPTKAPNLPVAGPTYDQSYLNQILNTLRLYFVQLDNFTGASSKVFYGTTAQRPAVGLTIGQQYFDTTLSSEVIWNGTAWQSAITSAAITSGTIDNTVIGATTPNTGTFTTITGQTEVLKGTGENFITYSQTFQNAAWTKQTNVTATDNATTAPDGSSTAASIAWGSASNSTGLYNQKLGQWTGLTNTKSIYIRADVAGGTAELVDPGTTAGVTTINLTTSWQRVSLSESAQLTYAGVWIRKTASSPNTIYLWGGQLEIGSVVNTYVPTTTTAVYGTPTLSFSGVAGLGLQSDGSLYVSPAGTGALQAQATTSSTVGGNARGTNAVDWQTLRSNAASVASGAYSVLSGGYNNNVSGQFSNIAGGSGHQINGYASFIGGGSSNNANGANSSAIVGGVSNTTAGYYNFIGGGFTNSATSGSPVTTQSGTMNATTAVTLSGSNANIKVGQYITGTSIASDTYVAAISGTALTLSKNASGSSTSTLSFYTPHGVVVGGGNNQATGSYSFIGGGGDAGNSGGKNLASGDWSVVVGGRGNQATGLASFVGGGGFYGPGSYATNSATSTSASVLGGWSNNATSAASVVTGGEGNLASGAYSMASGAYATTRGVATAQAISGGIFSAQGDAQSEVFVLGVATSNATTTELQVLSYAGTGAQGIPSLPAPSASTSSVYTFRGLIAAKNTATTDCAGWEIKGVIQRTSASATSVAIVGSPIITLLAATTGAVTGGWGVTGAITVTADTTNGGISVNATGAASTSLRWTCRLETAELA